MRKTLLILFTLSFFANFSLAQDLKPLGKYFYTISYFGEKVFHPGVQISINRSLYLSKNINNQKNRLVIGFSISNYVHLKNHIGLRLTPNVSFLHANNKGFEYGLKSGAGFMRRFYNGKVFEVDDYGNVKQKYLVGQNAFTYEASIVLAKNWYTRKSKNIRFYLEFGGFKETNYNESSLLHPVVNIGISQYFNLKK
jgi:hypothetical protein